MKLKDTCDIIIENAINNWRNSMITKSQGEQWESPNIQNQKLIKLVP